MHAPDAPPLLRAQQLALTRHLRDPQAVSAPKGVEDRRLAIYRDLVFNNVESLLAGNFPVIRQLLGDADWHALVRGFFRDHRAQTPLFPELGREFLRFLEAREDRDPALPAFLYELAHYEWVELALQISDATLPPHDPLGDSASPEQVLLDEVPVLSPLAWPLAYAWPVHRIGPDHRPDIPPPEPTLLLVRRDADGEVRFSQLSPLAFRLLQRLEQMPTLSGRAQLEALAVEAAQTDIDAFVEQGAALLAQMQGAGVILGTQPR
ncbi:putative DNA-binding domain-containing protein [Lysobacter sp. MMG2]|uniref:HvfC family RiPP maturation protein n=1 Tax=Lysobacter sp. MMG2 TaxID=2801338 RepID=UPI001C2239D0|nr:putative DNA-binding domain-containing protein [Lysobacter sp. MMG2]MBU8975009.1 putative DNA-binding domain-containing protein [Lysobacter sp. MMG2]